jgi:type VI secretion system secreted protein VgrG
MITQENRLITVDTPLGPDALLLTEFSGLERVSSLFSFELNIFSENHTITFAAIIGQGATVSLRLADGSLRYFNGIITRFSQQSSGGESAGIHDLAAYTATMSPWFWLLTRTSDSRIFQKLNVPDIVQQIFSEKGFQDFQLRLSGSYDPRDYCVQYRETDYNFIARLLEEEGIFYFFEHEEGKHTLVLADSPQENKPCPVQDSVRCQISGGSGIAPDEDVVGNFEKTQEIRIGKFSTKDYNFETPQTNLLVEVDSKFPLGPGEREIYDYPGEFYKRARGDAIANLRIQAEEAKITTINGSSNCRTFASGCKFTLTDHLRGDLNADYVLLSVSHVASQGVGGSEDIGGEGGTYANSFTCMPHEVPFKPSLNTPKPLIAGTQTAIVVGPAGEEIYTDKHGRVKVQFHWDREGKNDENSSCWIRVSQLWAGAGWGAMWIPRIGHEVIVEFVEGDPDRPIITGRVYHGNNTPPYPLPAEKTKSTIKSDSSKGGGGYNELRFEDKKGSEEIYIHGQKDETIVIENDKNQTVGHDETLSVGNDRSKTVGHDETAAVGNDETLSVGNDRSRQVGNDEQVSIGSDQTIDIGSDRSETVGSDHTEGIGKNMTIEVGNDRSISVGSILAVSVGKDHTEQVKNNYSLSAKNITIEAKDSITIKVGKASITMKKSGDINMDGKKINVKGSGNIVMKGSKILQN